jgi:hypothetical protein
MRCSRCGNTEHFYKYTPVHGKISTYYHGNGKYDGTTGMNMDMYEGVMHGREQKTCYCATCHKKLTKKELEENNYEI